MYELQFADNNRIPVQDVRNLRGALSAYRDGLRNVMAVDADISALNLSHGCAYGARFDGSNLREADLSYCRLTGASFVNADLRDTNLNFSDFDGADLRGANFLGCSFGNGRIGMANLDGAIIDWNQHRFIYELVRRALTLDSRTDEPSDSRELEILSLFLAQDAGDERGFSDLLATLTKSESDWVLAICKPYENPADNASSELRGAPANA